MGRRALTAQERADRQIQRQEALRTKQTLELARECALDPNLRVVVDSTLPASYASQTTTATIDPPYANEDDNPLNPLARERHTASTPYEPPSLPGRSNTQQDVESHDAPLIAELSALAISGDGPAPSGVAIYNPIGFSPAEASTQPPPLTGQHNKYYHGYNNQSFQLDGNAQVSSPEAYHTMRSVTPSPSSPSLFYQDDHAVFEPGSPSHTSDIRGGFTSSSTSAPSPSGPGDPVLDGFLRSIYEQGTAGCADFLRAQSSVYDKVFRSFFARECECPRSCEIAEPGRTHTLQERTEYIQRYLPPLQSIFAEPGAEIHNSCTSVSRWEKFLSDRPPEPLSFRKTQASLSSKSVTITRQWDVDSIWLGAKSLSAIRPPNRFRLSFFPSHKSNIATNQIIQPHGLDLAHTRHTSIGSFSTGNVRFNVLVFFPNGSRSPTPASANSLSLDRFRDLYDDIIIPAAYETLPDHVKQEIPSSYDLIYAKSRAYQEKPGAGRWTADDESRTFRLAYSVPAEFLSQFWASVVQKANSHRMQTLRGKTIAYYQNPCLLFQAHDLKNVFAQPNLHESLVLFRDAILAGLDPEHLDLHSCWLDLGMRDHVSRQHQGQASSQNNQSSQHEPWTLLWKSACCRHLHRRLGGIVPEAPLDARYYRSSLLRDAGTYYTKARPTKSSNPGHPETRSPGIIRAKAYDCKRELFGVMFSDYKLFSSGFLPLLAFDEGMLRDLAGMDQNRQRAFAPKLSRSHIMRAWDANKRHLRAVSSARWYPNFGIRKEVTFRLDVILTMFARGALHPDLSTHTGPMAQEIPLNPSSDTQHYPYWIVPTSAVQSFISTQAARFILPLDDIFQEVTRKTVEGSPSTSSLDPVRQILAFYTAQLFSRLLIYALNEEDQEQHFDNWIWRSAWSVRPRGRSSVSVRRGLGLSAPIESTGMLWIPQSHVDWQRGNLSLEVLIHLYMARSPLQARLAHQPNVQVLTVSHVAVKRLFQRWLHDAQLSHDMDCPEKAKEYADKAIALAVEETARAYYQHCLAKLGSYWDRVRNKVGHQSLSALSRLQRAQDESTADTARILSAQTIRAIYEEAWAGYNQATSAGCDLAEQAAGGNMPDELPCWMATRQRLPPKDSWSDFVFGVLFHHPHAQPKWSQLYFLQLYRSFRELWGDVSVWAGQFDKHFGIRIGHYIRVMFNTDRSKEVGTSHGEGTWYHGKPPFFQIQLWAPYFSPPQRQKGIPLSSVYHCLRYPDGLSPSITSSVPTARDFQALDELIREHWIEIVDDVDVLCSASHSYIRRHCRSALLYVRFLSGPTWGQDGGVSFMQPWSIKPQDIQDCVEEDVFRVPVVHKSIPKHMLESIVSQPTFFLPTRDNVLGLLETIESLPGHSASFIARLSWTKCRMDNGGDQYDLRSHLGVKKQVAEPFDRRQMLLEQFLRQTEPPETEATSENILDVVDVQEGNEYEVMREGEVTDEDGGRSHGDDNIFSEDNNHDQQSSRTDPLPIDRQSPSHATRSRRRSPRVASAPPLTIDKPIVLADAAIRRPDTAARLRAPARPNREQIPADTIYVATPYSANTGYREAADTDEDEETSATETPGSRTPLQSEQIAAIPVSHSEVDHIVSPRSQTRLRVQRCRDRQHAARLQQIFQEATESQDLPFTHEFSALSLRDNAIPLLSLPGDIPGNEPRPSLAPAPESEPELASETSALPLSSPSLSNFNFLEDDEQENRSEASVLEDDTSSLPRTPSLTSPSSSRHGSSSSSSQSRGSPLSSRSNSSEWSDLSGLPLDEPEDLILSDFLQAISNQDTAGGPDFLRQQGDVYDRVLRTFFNHQCSCPSSDERAEPENTHTLQEHTEYVSRSLPPLQTIFAERGNACDPRASFPQWHSFLSDKPPEPLSLSKTQASLPHDSATVERQWDVDSIWLGAKSLSAIRAPGHFRLSFFPAYKSNISTAQVIQPHGLDLAHTRHTSIGTFITAGIRFSVLVFFPNGARSRTKASANSLSLARFRDLYDEIILPAIFETVPDHVRQEIPSSYDLLYAKSRAYQEKPGAGRWSAEDESRAFRLSYSIPASNLAEFWTSVVEKANLHRVQTKRGEVVPYFENPRLLFQAHDLKNTFVSQTVGGSLALFRDIVLAGLNASQIDMHSCWLDVGMRDHVSQPSSPSPAHRDERWTLLWKSACCDHLHDQLGGVVPEAPLVADQYRSYLLRDVGTYYAKAKPSRASNPGHPEARSPGIIRAKAYNCSKDLFGVMFSDYQLFSSGLLPLLAFDEAMLKDLAATDQNRQRAFVSQLNRSHLVDAWEANKRHMRAVATLKRYPNFGIRKEVTFRLDVILAMWADGMLDPDQNPHTGPVCWNVPFTSAASDQHCPFWVLPTETVVKFVSTQAARFLLPLDHIFLQASNEVAKPLSSSSSSSSSSSLDPVQQILGFYTAQLLCRLLIHSVDDEQEYGFDNWIWRPTWTVRTRGRGQRSLKQRRGLGLGDTIDTSGTLWIPDGHFNWQRGHIALEVLIDLYISRNPLQAKLARQSNVQALTANQVTIELRFQQLTSNARIEYDQGHREDAERLAGRAITLATQEIARAYHQHFLAKLHSYWDRTRGQVGRQKLPVLDLLKQAQEDSAAETSRIPTAQTIHGIYAEAWAKYCQVMTDDVDENDRSDFNMSSSSSLQSALPEELPCWMTTRRRLPPKNSWSDFLFQQIFCRAKPPTWNALFFLQLYRRFKEVWEKTCASLGPFDGCFSRQIGYYIQVAFNCDHSKEVGTSHGRTTWHHDKPPFFQIQYWAPYFSPPRAEENTPLSSVYRRREYPEGLSPCSTPFILTSREFGGIERAIWPHWVKIMHEVDSLRPSSHKTIQRHCRRALLYATYIAGPTWGRDNDVNFIQPWSSGHSLRASSSIDGDTFRVPVAETHISRRIFEETVSEPTILLPTRDTIIDLLDTMETLPGHSSTFLARLRWTRRRLKNQGDQYDIRSHLDARQEELETSAQDRSLLNRFLRQSQPPEWDVDPVHTPSSEVIEENNESEEDMEEDGFSTDDYNSN